MTNDAIREHCLSLPHTTEIVQWEDCLLFKIGGKMFAILAIDGHECSFKCGPDRYAELVELPDIAPASHNLWKYQWVTAETRGALGDAEFRERLTESYWLVRRGLPKKVQAEFDAKDTAPAARRRKRVATTSRNRARRA